MGRGWIAGDFDAMIIYDRYIVTDANLAAANMPEDDAPEWNIATTYAAGAEVILEEFHRVYVSAINSNTGNKPAIDGDANWILFGATNRWAAFDNFVANRTEVADLIEYTITANTPVTSISLFGLSADSVTVTVAKDALSEVYTSSLASTDHINGSLWNWFTGGRPRLSEFAFLDLTYYGPGTSITIEIERTGATAGVGQIVLGKAIEIGTLQTNYRLTERDLNVYNEDEFGNIFVIRRPGYKITEMTGWRNNDNVRQLEQSLVQARGQFTVFIGTERSEAGLILLGLLLDYEVSAETKDFHRCRIEVRSLI